MFTNAIKLCSVCGFDIKVDPSWVLIAALITWGLSHQYFPQTAPGLSPQTYLRMSLIGMLCFFLCLLLHELAHSCVARLHGLKIKGITLFFFGGVAELAQEPPSARVEFWVALAGPVMSFALSFGFWGASQLSMLVQDRAVTEVLSYLAMINLVLAAFNMVPAFPLDGGRVLRAWLWYRSGDRLAATETSAKLGTVFAYTLMVIGVLSLFRGSVVNGLWYVMIGLFVLGAARASYQTQLAKEAFSDKRAGDLMTAPARSVSPDMTLLDFADTVMLKHRISFAPVVEDGVLLGHIDRDLLAGIDRENWSETRVGDVFSGLEETSLIHPDTPVPTLMALIAKTGHRKFLVVDRHVLHGVLTLSDLTEYLHAVDQDRHRQSTATA